MTRANHQHQQHQEPAQNSVSAMEGKITVGQLWPEQDKKPSDLTSVSPVPCDFALGDRVVFTNEYGVKFDLIVRGFAAEPHTPAGDPDWPARFIYVFTDAWWFSVAAESLAHRDAMEAKA